MSITELSSIVNGARCAYVALCVAALASLAPLPSSASAVMGGANTTSITSGLVGYWTMDGTDTNWKTGTMTDRSGMGNTGTLVGMSTSTSPVAGKVGQALKFLGRLQVPNSSSLNPNNAITVAFWIKGTPSDAYGGVIGKIVYGTAGWSINQLDTLSAIYMRLDTSAGINQNIGGFSVLDGKWHHVVYTLDSGNKLVYKDGVLVAQGTYNHGTGFANNQILSVYNGSVPYTFDDVRIYNRALSAQEVKQLYALGSAKIASSFAYASSSAKPLSSGLVAWWTLDGTTINWNTGVVQDSSGNGKNAQIIGMSTSSAPVAGKVGTALTFNGTSSYLDAGTIFNGFGAFTVSSWVKLSSIADHDYMGLWGQQDFVYPTVANTWMFFIGDNAGAFGTSGKWNDGTNFATRVTHPVPVNVWHHIVQTYNGTTVKSYDNGVLVGSASYSSKLLGNAEHFLIGKVAAYPGYVKSVYIPGVIDDVRIYNRALSAQEVKQLYALGSANVAHSLSNSSGQATAPLSSGLVGYWTMDGTDTNWKTGTMTDRSGMGNTGTLVGMSTSTSPVAGKVGQALKFNGSTNYINVPTGSLLSTQATICLWVNTLNLEAQDIFYPVSLGKDGAIRLALRVGGNFSDAQVTSKSISLFDGTNGASASANSFTTADYGKWRFICAIYDSSKSIKSTFYKNAVPLLTATDNISGTLSSQNSVQIGCRTDKFWYWNGGIDDVRIYNRALSAQEINQLYLMGR